MTRVRRAPSARPPLPKPAARGVGLLLVSAAFAIASWVLAGLDVREVGAQPGPAPNELATVLDVAGSDKLLVRNDAGLVYRVQYIGVRGPVRSSAMSDDAAGFHRPLVQDRWVYLETDGKDEDEGYKLRHAYLEGSTVPLAASALEVGWAVAAPYPVDHRHRELYLQLQENAMATPRNLWARNVLGPAAPWRPLGSAESGYVAADPDLHIFLDLLYTVPTGQSVINRLLRTVPIVRFRFLEDGVGGYAEARNYSITMSRRLGVADPRAQAAAIAHEGTHAIDYASGAQDLTSFTCFELEQRAHGIQAQVWAEFFGPGGKAEPQDSWDRAVNDLLRFAQRGDMQNYVRRSAGYEAQCARERVPTEEGEPDGTP